MAYQDFIKAATITMVRIKYSFVYILSAFSVKICAQLEFFFLGVVIVIDDGKPKDLCVTESSMSYLTHKAVLHKFLVFQEYHL